VGRSVSTPGVCGVAETRVASADGVCGVVEEAGRVVRTVCPTPAVCTPVGAESRCTRTPGEEGALCNKEYNLCAPGLLCAGRFEPCGESVCRMHACGPALGFGAPCSNGLDSVPGACDATAGLQCVAAICIPLADEPGDACDFACANGLRCAYGVCEPPGEPGDFCFRDTDCREGRCSGDAVCVPAPACG